MAARLEAAGDVDRYHATERRIAVPYQAAAVPDRSEAEQFGLMQLREGAGIMDLGHRHFGGTDAGDLISTVGCQPTEGSLEVIGFPVRPGSEHRGGNADRPRGTQRARLLRGADNGGGRVVADRRTHRQRQRPRHLARGQHIVGGHRVLVLGLGIKRGMPVVFRRNLGDVALGRPEAVHVIARQ